MTQKALVLNHHVKICSRRLEHEKESKEVNGMYTLPLTFAPVHRLVGEGSSFVQGVSDFRHIYHSTFLLSFPGRDSTILLMENFRLNFEDHCFDHNVLMTVDTYAFVQYS